MTTPVNSRAGVGRLLRMALPLAGRELTGVFMLVVDGVICGHIADGGVSLTALGFAIQLALLAYMPARALGVGTVAIAARASGAQDTARLHRCFMQSAQLAAIVGTALAIAFALSGYHVFRLLGASPAVAAVAIKYFRMFLIGLPAMFVSDGCLEAILRSTGNTRLPFVCGLAANVVNLVLAYALVFGHLGLPEMGIAGAGLATALARLFMVVVMYVAARGELRLAAPTLDREIVGQIVRVALPVLLERLMFFSAMTGLVVMLAHVDESAVAAHAIGARTAGLLQVPAYGIEGAMGALVGNALGARDIDEARRVFRRAVTASLVVMIPISLGSYIFAAQIAAAYDASAAARTYAIDWLHIVAIAVIMQTIAIQIEGLLLGAGASATVMRINVLCDIGVRIVAALVLGFALDLGAVGVWLSWPATLVVQLPLLYHAYRRGAWAVTGATAARP